MALSILAFAYAASTILPERDTGPVIAISILPIALALVDFLIGRRWKRLQGLQLSSD